MSTSRSDQLGGSGALKASLTRSNQPHFVTAGCRQAGLCVAVIGPDPGDR
jgi:hypothetical protein